MASVEVMMRLEYCHKVLCKCFQTASHCQDVKCIICASCFTQAICETEEMYRACRASTMWSCIYVVRDV